MSKLYRPTPSEGKWASPCHYKKNGFLTDVFTVSGLFPSTEEVGIDTYLIRQHLLHETRQLTRNIIDNEPEFRQLHIKHCSPNTPAGSRVVVPTKRVLPSEAYINVEPRKSLSEETIECVGTVTEMAALNTNDRNTSGRSLVLQQTKLFQVDNAELTKSQTEKLRTYKLPAETYHISKMKEAVDNLYALEMEMPFMKALKEQSRVKQRGRCQSVTRMPSERPPIKSKTESTSRVYVKKRTFLPLLKKEDESAKREDAIADERPYLVDCFLGKKRTRSTINSLKKREISVSGQTLKNANILARFDTVL